MRKSSVGIRRRNGPFLDHAWIDLCLDSAWLVLDRSDLGPGWGRDPFEIKRGCDCDGAVDGGVLDWAAKIHPQGSQKG